MYLLPPKTPLETKLITFDFAGDAAGGTTLSSPTVTKTTLSGNDPGAVGLTITGVAVAGQTVTCLVAAGVEGASYRLVAKATASNSEVHELAARLVVRATAA